MKTTILIQGDVTQVVLRPEDEFEQLAVKALLERDVRVEIAQGNFAECRGGYFRDFGGSQSVFLVARRERVTEGAVSAPQAPRD